MKKYYLSGFLGVKGRGNPGTKAFLSLHKAGRYKRSIVATAVAFGIAAGRAPVRQEATRSIC
jgi:hypothetical protein